MTDGAIPSPEIGQDGPPVGGEIFDGGNEQNEGGSVAELFGTMASVMDRLNGGEDESVPDDVREEAGETIKGLIGAIFSEKNTGEEVDEIFDMVSGEFGLPTILSETKMALLETNDDSLVFVSPEGRLARVEVDEDNARSVLDQLKEVDAELDSSQSYGMRAEIMGRSGGNIASFEAFTIPTVDGRTEGLDGVLADPENWIPERRMFHAEVETQGLEDARDLSERLGDEQPTSYALRGNTAAGKTTAVRNHEMFSHAVDGSGEVSGALNPDNIKSHIMAEAAEQHGVEITHAQAHEESSTMNARVSNDAVEEALSIVIDKRLSSAKNYAEIAESASEHDRRIKMLDIDVPLEVTVARVLQREAGGEDPIPPFGALASGFKGVRENRAELIVGDDKNLQGVANSDRVDGYVLMAMDASGEMKKVAERTSVEDQLQVFDQDEFIRVINGESVNDEIEATANTPITEQYVDAYIGKYASNEDDRIKDSIRRALLPHVGRTLQEAVDAHSSAKRK